MQTHHDHRTLTSASRLRDQATDVLRRLIEERESFRRRLEETGKRDPMTVITGRSAVDAAIARTRTMIVEMDKLLTELDSELSSSNGSTSPQPVAASA